MAGKITEVGRVINEALADNVIDDADAERIIAAVNTQRDKLLQYDRNPTLELQALDSLIKAPSRPFDIKGRAAQRIVNCALTPPNIECR